MSVKKGSTSKNKCSFCGCTYETFSFKHGYVCDGCLQYIKSCNPDDRKRDESVPDEQFSDETDCSST
ncbi:MAG: hypothetical protein IJH22_06605 [Firmicutes bacterium]|nr:hypothetical protein [Bacillota bacterium]